MGAVRARIEVRGRVQGVGFRPFVYRLARELRLGGSVANNPCGVSIEVEGAAADVETFERRLTAELPPLAVIERVTAARYEAIGQTAFRILPSPVAVDSGNGRVQEAHISPDVAVCADCLREVRNPTDRRHGYPFTNCTNCGPRYSIIHGVPYDRPNTTMSRFVMCAACQAEYDHPADRRFHAQPNACPDCGPRLSLVTPDGSQIGGNAVVRAAAALRRGAIVAIKGVGGFHLACRADHDAAVRRLRERKHRETKPLAIMVPDLAAARRICEVTDGDAALLESPEAPIVLMPKGADQNPSPPWGRGQGEGENRANPTLPRPLPGREGSSGRRAERPSKCGTGILPVPAPAGSRCHTGSAAGLGQGGASISPAVAPGAGSFGVMLPYTPLHHLLFDQGLGPLVMTSGNPSDEPLCADNAEAMQRLAPLADVLLLHDRDIHARLDDSVVVGGIEPAIPLRRARGYVPGVIRVKAEAKQPILALGGELKATVCILDGHDAVVSEHLGDLSSAVTFRHYVASIDRLSRLLRVTPARVAHDLHPGYQSTVHAKSLSREVPLPPIAVQHHHAHIVSCLADNQTVGPVVGIACDGTGYGPDGAIWGGEILIADEAGFERAARLRYFGLPGGDAGAQHTWRPALSLVRDALGDDWRSAAGHLFEGIDGAELRVVETMLQRGVNCPPTSSLGRLFDGAAFLLGLADENRHEAQAAMALEAAAAGVEQGEPLAFEIETDDEAGSLTMNWQPLVRALVQGVRDGRSCADLAAAFHATVSAMLVEAASRVARQAGLRTVALSGGCFLNRLLTGQVRRGLIDRGFEVLTHRRVPPGDGGISLGQAVVAARRLEQGVA